MIQAEGLTKYYGDFRAVQDVTFSINAGEIVGLLGPNGAGKTTTLRLLTGYMAPTAGQVHIGGYDVFEQALQAKQLIGYLPEHPPIYPELTVREYVQFAAELHGVARSERSERIDEALERTSLVDVQARLIGNLSRGFQQRTGLAQVLVKNPKVLILDEPTVGLDPKQIADIRSLITGLAGDYTVILSSHILQEVSASCDRVIIINKGQVVAQGSQQDLLQRQQKQKLYQLKLKGPRPEEAQKILSSLVSVDQVQLGKSSDLTELQIVSHANGQFQEELFHVLSEKKWIPYELAPVRSNLEDLFLRLTEDE